MKLTKTLVVGDKTSLSEWSKIINEQADLRRDEEDKINKSLPPPKSNYNEFYYWKINDGTENGVVRLRKMPNGKFNIRSERFYSNDELQAIFKAI